MRGVQNSLKGYPCAFRRHRYKRIPMCILRAHVMAFDRRHYYYRTQHLTPGTATGHQAKLGRYKPCSVQFSSVVHAEDHRTPSEPWKIQTLTVQFSCSRRRSKFTYGSAQGDRDPRTFTYGSAQGHRDPGKRIGTYVKREGFEANL